MAPIEDENADEDKEGAEGEHGEHGRRCERLLNHKERWDVASDDDQHENQIHGTIARCRRLGLSFFQGVHDNSQSIAIFLR
jgi:hypothetical protein